MANDKKSWLDGAMDIAENVMGQTEKVLGAMYHPSDDDRPDPPSTERREPTKLLQSLSVIDAESTESTETEATETVFATELPHDAAAKPNVSEATLWNGVLPTPRQIVEQMGNKDAYFYAIALLQRVTVND